jgi:general secretion pathway protein G
MNKGFTLMEIMVVVVILGLLATIVIVNVVGRVEKAKVDLTKVKIKEIEKAIDYFKMDNNRLPNSLDELRHCPPDVEYWPQGGYLKEEPLDGWNREFEYRPGEGTKGYIIISYGADGQPGGEGNNADITNEQAK